MVFIKNVESLNYLRVELAANVQTATVNHSSVQTDTKNMYLGLVLIHMLYMAAVKWN